MCRAFRSSDHCRTQKLHLTEASKEFISGAECCIVCAAREGSRSGDELSQSVVMLVVIVVVRFEALMIIIRAVGIMIHRGSLLRIVISSIVVARLAVFVMVLFLKIDELDLWRLLAWHE